MAADPALLRARRPPTAGPPSGHGRARGGVPLPQLAVGCATCWQQGKLWEPGPLGLMPVVCPDCGPALND
jgi:hypothetical protein